MTLDIDNVPYEIKRLIYDRIDFQSLKSLRQVSKAWASAGLSLLLLPEFRINSSRDIDRLSSISTSPDVSREAARTVRSLIFQSRGWDPRYFRNIVCSRHELRQGYEAIDFVPTQAEQAALDELDDVIAQNDIDLERDWKLSDFVAALRVLPRVDTVMITTRNPFSHPILRKSWEEYDLEAFQRHELQHHQMENIFYRLSMEAGLKIQHFTHKRLLSGFFDLPVAHIRKGFYNLQSLSLVISDLPGKFSASDDDADDLEVRAYQRKLQSLLYASPHLTSLKIHFEALGSVPAAPFLYPPTAPSTASLPAQHKLHTLTLSNITFSQPSFLSFLTQHAPTLRRLSLHVSELPTDTVSWHEFLSSIRALCGDTLEKFQLCGVVRNPNSNRHWFSMPMYDADWNLLVENDRNRWTRDVDRFVCGGPPAPEWLVGAGGAYGEEITLS